MIKYQDRRLLCLLFDMTSMQPPEQLRAQEAAIKFLETQMTSNDLVEIMTFNSNIKIIEEFTADRERLITTLKKLTVGAGSDFADMASTTADEGDDSGSFAADDTEFNIFNTDRKLSALEDASKKARSLSREKGSDLFHQRRGQNRRRESIADQGHDQRRRSARTSPFIRSMRAAWSPTLPGAMRPKPLRAAQGLSPEPNRRALKRASRIRRKPSPPSRPIPAARRCSTPTT